MKLLEASKATSESPRSPKARLARALLILEVFVCFGPAIFLLLIAIQGLVYVLGVMIITEPVGRDQKFLSLIMFTYLGVLAGIGGVIALWNLLKKIFYPNSKALHPGFTLSLGTLGFLPLFVFLTVDADFLWKAAMIAPLIASFHLAYLGRNYLFRW